MVRREIIPALHQFYCESSLHQRDAEAVKKKLAADFRDHQLLPGTPPNPEAALQYRAMLHEVFPATSTAENKR